MGFSITCVAVATKDQEAFLGAAGVSLTETPDPDGASLIAGAVWQDHFLIWRNLRAAPLTKEPDWIGLSQAVPLIVLDVVDTAGAQMVRCYEGGEEVWTVSYMDDNEDLLAVEGDVPVDVAAIQKGLRDNWLAAHPEDVTAPDEELVAGYGMELPARVFEELTGFYYEDGVPEDMRTLSGDLPLVKLGWDGKRKDPSDKPWWKFW